MTKLIFIRHSTPLIDPTRPARDWVLSAEGHAAATALAERLVGHRIGKIISSNEPKARQTAEAIAIALHLPLSLDKDLREHERANVGYLPRPDFEASIARFFTQPGELAFGEETADHVFARFSGAVERGVEPNQGTIALVTHGTALTLYLARTIGIAPLPFWHSLTLPMAIAVEGGALSIL
jgi:broad specificity phosphatase PhoE